LVVTLVLAAGCLSPVMTFGGGKTPKQAQHKTMSDFTPGRLVVEAKWNGEVTTKKIRVWADNQFRTQNIKWQQTFESTIELANLVLEPLFGLRLVGEYRAWQRHVPASTLVEDLEALAARDPGTDVFAVVGLTSSLPLVSATFDELGIANVGGRHLMVRGYADLEERKLYEDAFRDLLPEERELALEQRRQHKTAVVLLHELGHALGLEHDDVEDFIMSASYSIRASKLSSSSKERMLAAINVRVGRSDAPAVTPATVPIPATAAEPSGPLVFHVTVDGSIKRGDKIMDEFDLDNLLDDAFARDPKTEIVIRRARKAPANAIEKIVSRATAIGLTRVSISLY
jgi:hypothetical protein